MHHALPEALGVELFETLFLGVLIMATLNASRLVSYVTANPRTMG